MLVVGAGNSECDGVIGTSHVAAHAAVRYSRARHGKPADTFAAIMQRLPQRLQHWLQKISLRIQTVTIICQNRIFLTCDVY